MSNLFDSFFLAIRASDSDVLNRETTPKPISPGAFMPQDFSDWKTDHEFEPTDYDIWMMEDRYPTFAQTRVSVGSPDSSPEVYDGVI